MVTFPGRGRTRFTGAGGSAERKFEQLTRENVRAEWRMWSLALVTMVAFAVWSFYSGRVGGRVLAGASGALGGVLLVIYSLGGHISAFRWWLGAEGERETGKEIEKLGPDWHCEHDVAHEHGNWDHVLVGPPGIFLLDSKLVHGRAEARADALRSGRLFFSGGAFRSAARRMNEEIERELGSRAPWVQAVVVVWGDFPQARHEEENVVYVRGEELVLWLEQLPEKLNRPRRAACTAAVQEVRGSLRARVKT